MLRHKGTLTIETEHLILRKFTIEDARDMFNNCVNDDKVARFLSWIPHDSADITKKILTGWIKEYEKPDTYSWCIVLKESSQAVGHIAVNEFSETHERCDIGYYLGRSFWNRGLMTEALKAVIDFLFFEVGMNRIQAKHDAKNPASGKVMEKAGMKYEGTLKKYKKHKDGTFGSSDIYAITKDELLSILREDYHE